MAESTGKNKIVDDSKVENQTFLSLTFLGAIMTLMISLSAFYGFDIYPMKSECSGIQSQGELAKYLSYMVFYPCTVANSYFDRKLLRFVDEFNRKHPDVMVIWSCQKDKTMGRRDEMDRKAKLEKQLENTIPKISSSITFGLLGLVLVIMALANIESDNKFIMEQVCFVLISKKISFA